MSQFKLFTDGGSRGNPGKAACGYFIFNDENLVDSGGKFLGIATNNNAEYHGLIEGLKLSIKHGIEELNCYLDSELIVKQLNGEYKVKHEDMKKLFAQVQELKSSFEKIAFNHVPRAQNKFADAKVNEVLDGVG